MKLGHFISIEQGCFIERTLLIRFVITIHHNILQKAQNVACISKLGKRRGLRQSESVPIFVIRQVDSPSR